MQIDQLLARFERVIPAGPGRWRVRCPAHEDLNPSLAVTVTEDQTVLLHCHAGCNAKAITEAIGLSLKDLFPSANGNGKATSYFTTAEAARDSWIRILGSKGYALEDVSTFHDDSGKPIIEELRFRHPVAGKTCRPISRCLHGWQLKLPPAPRPIFGLPAIMSRTAETVHVVEGARKAKLLNELGFVATASSNGAQGFKQSTWASLAGRAVAIFPDADGPGKKYAQGVAGLLMSLNPPARVKIVELPGLEEGGDIIDLVRQRREDGKDNDAIVLELKALVKLAPEHIKTAPKSEVTSNFKSAPEPVHLTDVGNGKRLVQAHGKDLRHCHAWAKWLCWDTSHWRTDETGRIKALSKTVILELFREVKDKVAELEELAKQEQTE